MRKVNSIAPAAVLSLLLAIGVTGCQSKPKAVESRPGGAKDDSWLPDEGLDFESYIGGLELAIIRRSLEKTHGNKRQAAKLLNLKRTTLIEKLKRLEPPVDDSASKLS